MELIGYEPGRVFDNTCTDHWILMANPSLGDHITCAIQDAAEMVGFEAGARDVQCPILTASDLPGPQ